jgi:hypothetical protein
MPEKPDETELTVREVLATTSTLADRLKESVDQLVALMARHPEGDDE